MFEQNTEPGMEQPYGIPAEGNNGGTSPLDDLRQFGVPDDKIKELEGGFMRQQDYTRKTQEIAQQRGETERRLAFLEGKTSNLGKQEEDSDLIDQVLKKYDDGTQNSAAIRQILSDFAGAIEGKLTTEIGQRMAPFQQVAVNNEASRRVDDYINRDLVSKYGPEITKLTDKYRNDFVQALSAGQHVDPEYVLFRNHRDDLLRLEQNNKQRTAQTRATPSYGTVQPQYSSPAFGGGSIGAPSGNGSKPHQPISDVVREAMAAVGIRR